MFIYPAIDIRGGKCVRLIQGDYSQETVYLDDPVEAAQQWQKQGAKWIHVIDLDGAKTGHPANFNVIKNIRDAININIQVGGGIRSAEIAQKYLKEDINRIIFGSAAVKDLSLIKGIIEEYGADKVAVGVDTRQNEVAIHGWTKTSDMTVEEMLEQLNKISVKTIIFTDISKDGMMKGPNIDGIEKVLDFGCFSVIASGGISSMEDLQKLAKYENKGLDGAIIGKALYQGVLDLNEVLKRFSLKK